MLIRFWLTGIQNWTTRLQAPVLRRISTPVTSSHHIPRKLHKNVPHIRQPDVRSNTPVLCSQDASRKIRNTHARQKPSNCKCNTPISPLPLPHLLQCTPNLFTQKLTPQVGLRHRTSARTTIFKVGEAATLRNSIRRACYNTWRWTDAWR
jgi:hypothetical protein